MSGDPCSFYLRCHALPVEGGVETGFKRKKKKAQKERINGYSHTITSLPRDVWVVSSPSNDSSDDANISSA